MCYIISIAVRFNGPGKMNTISKGMQEEAQQIFSGPIATNPDVKAVIFMSSKPDNFIAGADIDMVRICMSVHDSHSDRSLCCVCSSRLSRTRRS